MGDRSHLDGIPGKSMISIDFRDARIDGRRPTERHEVLLRIVARLVVTDDGTELFAESEFPIVELAQHLWRWLRVGAVNNSGFTYKSMESEQEDLLWFARESDGWSIGSADRKIAVGLRLAEIRTASERFVDRVSVEIPGSLGVPVRDVIVGS